MLNEMKHLCSCIVDYTWRLGIVQRFFAVAQNDSDFYMLFASVN